MATVDTVTGPVDAGDLGLTLVHEHLDSTSEAVRFQWPHLYDEEKDKAAILDELGQIKAQGVKTIFDPGALGINRNVPLMRWASEQSGVQILAATGVYRYNFLPQTFEFQDEQRMVDCFVHDLTEGCQGTDAKAAFIKCAVDEPGIGEHVAKALRACATATKQTGKPIMAHSHPATRRGIEILDLFEEQGVDLSTVMIAHTGDTDDLDYIEELLKRGAWIGMDRYGLDILLPQDKRNATVLALCERGYADRMFISTDAPIVFDWYAPEMREELAPKWKPMLILDEVVPQLKELGVTDEQVDQMLVKNPAAWISPAS